MKMQTPYDPKLRLAAKEFEELCKKYDVMGSVILASQTHAEFLYFVNSTWSVARMEKAPGGEAAIRFRSKKEDFPSKEAQHAATEATVHGFTTFLQHAKMMQNQMENLLEMLRKHMKIMYQAWGRPYTGGDYPK